MLRSFRRRLLLLGLTLTAPLRAGADGGHVPDERPMLTLSEAVEIALSNSERMIDARDGVQQARLAVHLAQSIFRPKIVPNVLGSFGQSDQANQTYQLTLSKQFITGTSIQANVATTSLRNQLGNFWNTDTVFSIRQPILRGFGRSANEGQLTRSESGAKDAERRLTLAERDLALQVSAAYYGIVSQSLLVDVAKKSLERAKELLTASEAKLQAGRVSRLDVTRAEQLVAEAEGQLLDAHGTLEDSRDLFRELLELDHDDDFRVSTEIPSLGETMSEEEAVAIALENSLEIRTAREAIDDAEREVAHAKDQLRPQLDIGVAAVRGQTSESLGTTFGVSGYEVATFIAASSPIDRTAETIAYGNALIERDRRRRDLSRTVRRTTSGAKRAARSVERLFRSLQLAESKVSFSENEVEVATLRYQRGLGNNLDVVNAELALLTAQSRLLANRAELAVGRLQLLSVLGTLRPRDDI